MGRNRLSEHLGILEDVYGRPPRIHISADFKALPDHQDLVDADLVLGAIGRSSIAVRSRSGGAHEVCVDAKVVATPVGTDGATLEWPDVYRQMLLKSGRQVPEVPASGIVEDCL